jgi:hypothetical protein
MDKDCCDVDVDVGPPTVFAEICPTVDDEPFDYLVDDDGIGVLTDDDLHILR